MQIDQKVAFMDDLDRRGYHPSHKPEHVEDLQLAIAKQLHTSGKIMWYADFLEPLVDYLDSLHQEGRFLKDSCYNPKALFVDFQRSQRNRDELQQKYPGKSLEEIAQEEAKTYLSRTIFSRATYLLLSASTTASGFSVSNVYTLLRQAFDVDHPGDALHLIPSATTLKLQQPELISAYVRLRQQAQSLWTKTFSKPIITSV